MITQMVAPVGRWCRLALVVMLLVASLAGNALPGERRIDSLNFNNAEVTTVLKALADLSNANIVISPAVKGTITIKLTDVTVEEALQIITKELDLAYTVSGGAYVVGDKATISAIVPPVETYEIVKLKFTTAADVIAALSIAFKDVQSRELPDHRLLITGESKRLQAVLDFIPQIDVAKPQPILVPEVPAIDAVYPIKAVDPQQAKVMLEQFYGPLGLSVAVAPKSIEQTDTLMLHGPQPVIEKAIASLTKVDIPIKIIELRCSVKNVFATHAITFLLKRYRDKGLTIVTAPMTPDEVARQAGASGSAITQVASSKLVGNVIGTEVQMDGSDKLNITEPVGDFLLRGPEKVVQDAETALATIDIGPQRVNKIYSLRFLNVADAKKRLDDLFGNEGLVTSIAPGLNGKTPDIVNQSNTASLSGTTTTSAASGETAPAEVRDLILSGSGVGGDPRDAVARFARCRATADCRTCGNCHHRRLGNQQYRGHVVGRHQSEYALRKHDYREFFRAAIGQPLATRYHRARSHRVEHHHQSDGKQEQSQDHQPAHHGRTKRP